VIFSRPPFKGDHYFRYSCFGDKKIINDIIQFIKLLTSKYLLSIKDYMDKSQKQTLISQIKEKFRLIKSYLSQNELRIWAAVESVSIGRGGNTIVHEATGISRATIDKGKKELEHNKSGKKKRLSDRGRKRLLEKHPKLLKDIDGLIQPFERKEPVPTLRWTQESTYKIKLRLKKKGYEISQKSVYSIMIAAGYIMHTNQKKVPERSEPHCSLPHAVS
jgi:hypothetical protein